MIFLFALQKDIFSKTNVSRCEKNFNITINVRKSGMTFKTKCYNIYFFFSQIFTHFWFFLHSNQNYFFLSVTQKSKRFTFWIFLLKKSFQFWCNTEKQTVWLKIYPLLSEYFFVKKSFQFWNFVFTIICINNKSVGHLSDLKSVVKSKIKKLFLYIMCCWLLIYQKLTKYRLQLKDQTLSNL